MRPGDVLGALTGDIGLDGADIGKIAVHPAHVYVACVRLLLIKHGNSYRVGRLKENVPIAVIKIMKC